MTEIRADIAFAVNKLSRFANNPARVHWKALKRVLVYIYTTRQRRLVFGRDQDFDIDEPICVYMDAGHAGCKDTAKSTSGIVITVFGSTVWTKSKRQGKVANSTGAAELHAMDWETPVLTHHQSLTIIRAQWAARQAHCARAPSKGQQGPQGRGQGTSS